MYLKSVSISDIRSITNLELSFDKGAFAGWHVILGANGAGKSTVARSIALALTGPKEAEALRQDWSDWIQRGIDAGVVVLRIARDSEFDRMLVRGHQLIDAGIIVNRTLEGAELAAAKGPHGRYLWGSGSGWFCASFGPFRRFSGGDPNFAKLFYSHPHLAPHLSVFGEDVALTECLEWLKQLHVKKLEKDPEGDCLEYLKKFINEAELLPFKTKLKSVSSNGVVFTDGNGNQIPVNLLSDGYRSVLSMTFEMIRQMVRRYGADTVFASIKQGEMCIPLPGVVVIDEVDAHLHPSWQRAIGPWFRKYFPKLQFIVTTHSPLVCQAAEHGTVWQLPAPGQKGGVEKIQGSKLDRLLYGDILDAYDTDLFGLNLTRSESGRVKEERLAQLNLKKRRKGLTATEQKELQHLRSILPGIASDVATEG